MYVAGALAFAGGVFQPGFDGPGSSATNPQPDTLRVVVDPNVLVAIYREKGTAAGIKNAIRFFLGLEVDIVAYAGEGLVLGESLLGEDWVLGPSGAFAAYSFEVVVPRALTDEERRRLRQIVDYMKPAHTHFVRLVEPAIPPVVDHLELGLSELGETFTGNILPTATGLDLGSSDARWDAFLRDVNATASANGVAAVRGYSFDETTPAIRGSGAGFLVESDAIEASHVDWFFGSILIWDLLKGWTFLPQHTGDVPDAVEINGVTQRNIVKAWGSVTSAGTLNDPHWNVDSVSKPGTGRYSITLDVNPGTRNAVIVTVNSAALGADYSVHVYSPDGASFEVDINSGGALSDQSFMFVVLGA